MGDSLTTVTILYDDAPAVDAQARVDGAALWLSPEDFESATGWKLKPEGLCREQACVPLPRDGSWSDSEGRLDLAAFSARFKRPSVRDEEHSVWAFGEKADDRAPTDCSPSRRRTSHSPTSTAGCIRCRTTAARRSSSWPGGLIEAAASTCPCGRCSMRN
jgi:hypothetical protein